jgi:hypothetical protein
LIFFVLEQKQKQEVLKALLAFSSSFFLDYYGMQNTEYWAFYTIQNVH